LPVLLPRQVELAPQLLLGLVPERLLVLVESTA
jgi:hypothetical protein